MRDGAIAVTAVSFVIAVIAVAVFVLFPRQLVGLYLDSSDPETPVLIGIATGLMFYAALFQLTDAMQVIGLGLLRGVQDTRVPMIIAVCGYCIAGCPFNIPRLNKEDNRVYKCTLCVDRVSVGQEPACVKTCPTGAIHFGTKREMLEVAQQRVDKLKARGYENAGIYNPQGVGGTHVMYVLHHNDQPELYHNLPKDPAIDTSINLWKGALKPLSAAGFIATFAGLIYHYIGIGPNKEVDDDEEEHHE